MIDDNKKNIENIIKNYVMYEKELINQLNFQIEHSTTIGGFREEIWKSFFERIVPKKFKVERSVFIMDSEGSFSNEVDLAIFDEQYTPYVFKYGQIKFIPIEAVAAVIECKSTNFKNDKIREWIDKIDNLSTSNDSIARIVSGVYNPMFDDRELAQTATAPIKIFCHTPKSKMRKERIEKLKDMDIIIEAIKSEKTEKQEMNIIFNNYSLENCYEKINHKKDEENERKILKFPENLKDKDLKKDYEIRNEQEKSIPLLSFIFQFNQLLMLLNNPMFFPHRSYVKLFNTYNEK